MLSFGPIITENIPFQQEDSNKGLNENGCWEMRQTASQILQSVSGASDWRRITNTRGANTAETTHQISKHIQTNIKDRGPAEQRCSTEVKGQRFALYANNTFPMTLNPSNKLRHLNQPAPQRETGVTCWSPTMLLLLLSLTTNQQDYDESGHVCVVLFITFISCNNVFAKLHPDMWWWEVKGDVTCQEGVSQSTRQ